jgi:hypothetical protein
MTAKTLELNVMIEAQEGLNWERWQRLAQGGHADARCGDHRGEGHRRRAQGGGAHPVSGETERKRAEAQAARERLIGTVNELGTAVQDAKQRARERALAAAPYVVGGVGLITVLSVMRRRR